MENLEDFKAMWQELNQRLSHLENENKQLIHNMKRSNYQTAQEKLVKKYSGFIWVESIMICVMSLFFIFNPLINEKYRIVTLIYWDVFFAIEVVFDCYLLYQIKSIDIYTSSIHDMAKRAAANWKLHKTGIMVGLPLAFGAILLLALALNANEFTIYGMITGGIIGLIVGIRQLIKFRDYYKSLFHNIC